MIKSIIFDYGGVIGNNVNQKIYLDISKIFNVPIEKISEVFFEYIYKLELGRIKEDVFWEEFSDKLKIKEKHKLKNIWYESLNKNATIDEELLKIIVKLSFNYDIYLLSNNAVIFNKPEKEKKIKSIFKQIFYSHEIGLRKPENECYEYVKNMIQNEYKEILLIDDDCTKLLPAKNLGMNIIEYKSLNYFNCELEKILKNNL